MPPLSATPDALDLGYRCPRGLVRGKAAPLPAHRRARPAQGIAPAQCRRWPRQSVAGQAAWRQGSDPTGGSPYRLQSPRRRLAARWHYRAHAVYLFGRESRVLKGPKARHFECDRLSTAFEHVVPEPMTMFAKRLNIVRRIVRNIAVDVMCVRVLFRSARFALRP